MKQNKTSGRNHGISWFLPLLFCWLDHRLPNGGILHVLRLLRDLLEQNVLCVPAGTRDRASLEGVGQICIAKRFEIAAAAAGLAEVQIVLPCSGLIIV